jgi:hypothetical protein
VGAAASKAPGINLLTPLALQLRCIVMRGGFGSGVKEMVEDIYELIVGCSGAPGEGNQRQDGCPQSEEQQTDNERRSRATLTE